MAWTVPLLLVLLVVQAGAASAAPVEASAAGNPVFTAGKLAELVLALGAVILAAAALAWLGKRLHINRPRSGTLHIESVLALGPKDRVMVVSVDGERLLLGVGSAGISTLRVLADRPAIEDGQQEAASGNSRIDGFAAIVQSVLSGGVRR